MPLIRSLLKRKGSLKRVISSLLAISLLERAGLLLSSLKKKRLLKRKGSIKRVYNLVREVESRYIINKLFGELPYDTPN